MTDAHSVTIDPTTREITVFCKDIAVGAASVRNNHQLDMFVDLLVQGLAPVDAADHSGAIYLPNSAEDF